MATPKHPHDDYRTAVRNQVEDDLENLKLNGVRYTNDARSICEKRIRWYPRMFEGAMQNASSLVMMK